MGYEKLSTMLAAIASGGAKSMVRVAGYHDRGGIQQALDLGADGVLIPYINTAEEARQGIDCCLYPMKGTRSVYFPQRATNKAGLLGYVGNSNKNVIIALQVETAACIQNMEEIAAIPGIDILFLGQNDLCMSMGLSASHSDADGSLCEGPGRNWDQGRRCLEQAAQRLGLRRKPIAVTSNRRRKSPAVLCLNVSRIRLRQRWRGVLYPTRRFSRRSEGGCQGL